VIPDPEDPPDSPLPALAEWLPAEADPPLMTLATTDEQGRPDARTVLLSGWDERGLTFHTARGSRKTAQLAARPWATAVVVMPDLARQLVVSGPVEEVAPEEAAEAYHKRSRYLQLLAWLNTPQTAQQPLAERTRRWAEFDRAHPAPAVAPSWIGHRVQFDRVVFWQGREDCPSIRVSYRREAPGWSVERLPG